MNALTIFVFSVSAFFVLVFSIGARHFFREGTFAGFISGCILVLNIILVILADVLFLMSLFASATFTG